MGLRDELVELLRRHRDEQQRERSVAAQLGGTRVRVHHAGRRAGEPEQGLPALERLLADAGVRDGRLHDARHTAATVLLVLGVPERAVMGLMGWSATSMAARYQHVTGVVRGDVAQRVGALIWGAEVAE